MSDVGQTETKGKEFDWVELVPERTLLRSPGIRIFFIQVKSETPSGKRLHNDPIEFFRTEIPEMEIPDGVRASLLRANAERSANPRHRNEVWVVDSEEGTAAGVQYKLPELPE